MGLVLGLGLSFMAEGVRMAREDPMLAVVATALTFALLSGGRVPAMLALLALGGAVTILREPGLVTDLSAIGWSVRWPRVEPPEFSWGDLVTGILVLGLPQAALTFGNAVVATADENNRLFPDRPVTVTRLALGHGVINLVGGGLGGVPMCFGAGGMAGHVRFGARTGGATVVLGLLLLGIGLFLSESLATLLRLFPVSVLGVVLLFGGLELAVGAGASEHALTVSYSVP